MKPTALFVNTSRGAIVDESALASALRGGAIGGAAVDVYATEPIPSDHPLLCAPRTLLTPHIGITTRENYRMYYEQAAEDVMAYVAGRPVRVLSPGPIPIASRA
jgi:phosphoglycerate dehydrogenase-like enzyme